MNRRAAWIVGVVNVVFAVALVAVAWLLGSGLSDARGEVNALRTELADTRARLVQAETDRDRLQERVDALTQALLVAGVDPNTVPAEPSEPAVTPGGSSAAEAPRTGPPAASRPAPQSPAGRAPSPPRPAETQPPPPPPSPQPSPSPTCQTVSVLGMCLDP